MKIRYYLDIWPGANFAQYVPSPMANPGAKTAGVKRIAFDVTIPDHLIYDHDHVAPEVSKPELVADHDEDAHQEGGR